MLANGGIHAGGDNPLYRVQKQKAQENRGVEGE
jgi:hypothetical protein